MPKASFSLDISFDGGIERLMVSQDRGDDQQATTDLEKPSSMIWSVVLRILASLESCDCYVAWMRLRKTMSPMDVLDLYRNYLSPVSPPAESAGNQNMGVPAKPRPLASHPYLTQQGGSFGMGVSENRGSSLIQTVWIGVCSIPKRFETHLSKSLGTPGLMHGSDVSEAISRIGVRP